MLPVGYYYGSRPLPFQMTDGASTLCQTGLLMAGHSECLR
jgi:hypothetical protein